MTRWKRSDIPCCTDKCLRQTSAAVIPEVCKHHEQTQNDRRLPLHQRNINCQQEHKVSRTSQLAYQLDHKSRTQENLDQFPNVKPDAVSVEI
ncbi:hypothetical protein C4D60_Mb07t10310 [Musa balbisiana]|uniref:Uncharacterized protein n=1 Tax=Musa balbisiana TaxID=52838 RepID=A0A4V4H6J7_MUSBA|nr:hypothetical protein C4D60_Mb07t10310 [Musa balbisiana]